MNNSKKIVTASVVALLVFAPVTVLAQGRGVQEIKETKVGKRAEAVLADDVLAQGRGVGSAVDDATGEAVVESRGIGEAVRNLTKVSERNNDPGIGEQVRVMAQNHEQVQVRTKTALGKMNERSAAVKFMIGPDYKNAGQVRSEVVGLRNDISKLDKIKEEALPEDVGDIQGAMDELEAEATDLEVQLEEQLSGVSLFGWLAKLFAN